MLYMTQYSPSQGCDKSAYDMRLLANRETPGERRKEVDASAALT